MSVLSIEDINIHSLCRRFEESLVISNSGSVVPDMAAKIYVKVGDNTLFEYTPGYKTLGNLNPTYNELLQNLFKISGVYEMNFEFTPNNTSNINSDNTYFYNNKDAFLKKIETFNDYEDWFNNIFSCFSGNVILIPDTNFLLYCYYSNYLKKIIQKKDKVSFCLSRLTLLEIERQINDLSESIKKDEKALRDKKNESKKEGIQKQIIENQKQNRLRFQTISEISTMMKEGANIIPTDNINLLNSFPKASGNAFADSWIRMEISNYNKTIQDQSITDIIFVTGDLLNALMSVAENINTIYIYNRKEIRKIIDILLYTLSNYFEKINLIIRSNASDNVETYILNGIWEGKTVEEWSNKKVKFAKSL